MKRSRGSHSSLRSLVAGIATVVGASVAVYHSSYLPYRCNQFKPRTESSMLVIQNIQDPVRRAMMARKNLQLVTDWLRRCPNDLDLYMIAGGTLRQLGRSDEAVPMYERALLLDRRPEIYLNLGQAQAEAGVTDQAVANLARAVMFDPSMITEVPAMLQENVQSLARAGSKL
jgi:tetratricopeptide (TPR) repeat protein